MRINLLPNNAYRIAFKTKYLEQKENNYKQLPQQLARDVFVKNSTNLRDKNIIDAYEGVDFRSIDDGIDSEEYPYLALYERDLQKEHDNKPKRKKHFDPLIAAAGIAGAATIALNSMMRPLPESPYGALQEKYIFQEQPYFVLKPTEDLSMAEMLAAKIVIYFEIDKINEQINEYQSDLDKLEAKYSDMMQVEMEYYDILDNAKTEEERKRQDAILREWQMNMCNVVSKQGYVEFCQIMPLEIEKQGLEEKLNKINARLDGLDY